jgi:hypothetical protein
MDGGPSPTKTVRGQHGDFAAQSERIDRIELHLERIERRLDIVHV